MPFSYHGGFVSALLQEFGDGLLAAVEDAVFVVGESVLVAVLAGEQAGPGGAAQGVGHETVGKAASLFGQTVDGGSLHVAAVVRAHRLVRVVVAHDVDYVELLSVRGAALLVPFAGGGEQGAGEGGGSGDGVQQFHFSLLRRA